MMPPARVWSIFCRVIDNFGDMGICWRLARQLQQEQAISVELWVDDIAAMRRFLAKADPRFDIGQHDAPIILHHWQDDDLPTESVTLVTRSDVIVEAFGCGLPQPVLQAMALLSQPPLWIHLDYLSAENWVEECHGLVSTLNVTLDPMSSGQNRQRLKRHFFFPGFTSATGALLRERHLLAEHSVAQSQPRMSVLRNLGLPDTDLARIYRLLKQHPDTVLVSVFCYPTLAWTSWLQAIAEGDTSTLCLASESLPDSFFETAQAAGAAVVKIPFLPQPDYDRLLGVCDLNIVRGEDSFVRAQWAARPLLWHIYPQQDGVHLDKLHAFLALYRSAARSDSECSAFDALVEFTQRWNSGADCRKTWHDLRPQLPQLRTQARNWQLYLAGMPDLVTLLVSYCGEVRSKSES